MLRWPGKHSARVRRGMVRLQYVAGFLLGVLLLRVVWVAATLHITGYQGDRHGYFVRPIVSHIGYSEGTYEPGGERDHAFQFVRANPRTPREFYCTVSDWSASSGPIVREISYGGWRRPVFKHTAELLPGEEGRNVVSVWTVELCNHDDPNRRWVYEDRTGNHSFDIMTEYNGDDVVQALLLFEDAYVPAIMVEGSHMIVREDDSHAAVEYRDGAWRMR